MVSLFMVTTLLELYGVEQSERIPCRRLSINKEMSTSIHQVHPKVTENTSRAKSLTKREDQSYLT